MILLWSSLALAGSLHGTVTDSAGDPVQSTTVVAYDRRLDYLFVNTDATGAYRLDNVPAGPRRLRILPPGPADLAETWVGDTLRVCEAEIVDIGPDADVQRDVTLFPGGTLRGRLTDAQGVPVVGALVAARTLEGLPVLVRADRTDEQGAFLVPGVASEDGGSTYRLEVVAEGYPLQDLGPSYGAEGARAFDVVPGAALEAGTNALLQGISVGGMALGPGGPVAEGTVRVFSGGQVLEVPVEDGVWSAVGLPPGEVVAWARAPGLATTWWPDLDRPGPGRVVQAEGSDLDDLDITLPAESRLTARLVGDGALPAGLDVLAYNDDGTVTVPAVSEADGSVSIGTLHPGRYTLYVFGQPLGYLEGFASDTPTVPSVFDVPSSATPEVALPLGATLRGRVTEAVSGTGLYGATIRLAGQGTGVERLVRVDREGHYAAMGLPADVWAVHARYDAYCPGDPSFVSLFYPDQVNPGLVGVIELSAGDDRTWDVALPPDDDQDGMDDRWEADHGLDPARDDGAEDSDGDGYTNLDEFLLGTDPSADLGRGGCGGGDGAAVLLLPWCIGLSRRRQRV